MLSMPAGFLSRPFTDTITYKVYTALLTAKDGEYFNEIEKIAFFVICSVIEFTCAYIYLFVLL